MEAPVTDALIAHVLNTEYEAIPPHAIEVQKQSLADLLSVMMAATSIDKPAQIMASYAEKTPGTCTLLASEVKVSAREAALANGSLAHALDYEDSHEQATIHPNSQSTPALLALAEELGGVSGRQLLTALVLASDVACRLDLGANQDLLKFGFNMPAIHGGMGAVMGAGKLLGLGPDQMCDAISMQMCQAVCSGESARSKGSCMRTLRDGFAAQAAVQSAQLAQLGVPARFDQPIEGKLGYYHAFAHDDWTPEHVTQDLGSVYQSEFISFKPWPACRATHTTIEGLLKLRESEGLRSEDICSVHVTMQEIGRMTIEPKEAKYRPQSSSVAKFSLPFLVGTVMKYGEVTLDSFSDERLHDPDVLALADKVSVEINEQWTKAQNKLTDLEVVTTKGTFSMHMDHPLGCNENPMSTDQKRAKFLDCARRSVKGYSDEQIGQIFEAIQRIDECADVREFTELL
ncbi:MAG: MmgE/PrpD family protein [Coriobacteriales bacterium]|nr:MmgE/PrpD family protein [Coriobacteriales bacterium]